MDEITIIPNQTKISEENCTPISLMGIDANIFYKIQQNTIANWIQQHVKGMLRYDQVGFVVRKQVWLNIPKSVNVMHHINKEQRNT